MFTVRQFRRNAVAGILAAVVLLTATFAGVRASSAGASVNSLKPKPTIVLVHGAWADSSSWDGVIQRLHASGYTVDAFPTPLRSISGDSAQLSQYIAAIQGPIILVGHSYGGAIITNAGTDSGKIKALVYIDAFAPAKGETLAGLESKTPGSCLAGGGNPQNVFNLVPDSTVTPQDYDLYAKVAGDTNYPGFAACFANDLPAGEGRLLAATQRPPTLSSLGEISGQPAWKIIPSWYMVGTRDHVIPPAEQFAMASRAHAHIEHSPASHLAMISHPGDVTKIIVAAARATA